MTKKYHFKEVADHNERPKKRESGAIYSRSESQGYLAPSVG